MQPCITLILAAVCLKPGISLQMADHPAGIHHKSRGHCLGMQFAAWNGRKASVHTFKHLIPYKTGTKSFRTVKFKIVAFRLVMLMGQIS